MPNVTWQEPQVLVDLLAMNLLADENQMSIPAERRISVVSPWFTEVELFLRPGAWHRHLQLERSGGSYSLNRLLSRLLLRGWTVDVAVLAYGVSPSGLTKDPNAYQRERDVLRYLAGEGASIYLVPDLHAKGVVSPLGLVTGSTNITRSGMFLQSQNANYFAFDHPDYSANAIQLRAKYDALSATATVP